MEKSYQFSIALIAILLMQSLMVNTTNITTDQLSLLSFKAQITSDPLKILATNWSTRTSPCDWVGITCGSRHHRVTHINLSGMNLVGRVPHQLSDMSFLVSINLQGNNFSGNLPGWLNLLPKLKFLDLHNNSFTGLLPSLLSNISMLEVLSLGDNFLQGGIPEEIGNLYRLKVLAVEDNQLTGSIPFNVFNISTLQVINLGSNDLSGNLSPNMCNNHPTLVSLDLSNNKLFGEIPESLSRCIHLQNLSFSLNNFEGHIPRGIGNLSKLENLTLIDNLLRGPIPQEIGNLIRMKSLEMGKNHQITGSIPLGIFNNMTSLEYLDLELNSLVGTLPTNICQRLPRIERIFLGFNFLYGSIPGMLDNCSVLQSLSLGQNRFTGEIPSAIFNISTLIGFDFQGNFLHGSLPSSMCYGLPNIQLIYLSTNSFTGVLPESISNCSTLMFLELGVNEFSGPIPNSLGKLDFLTYLNLAANHFKNDPSSSELSLIDSLTNCRQLVSLQLSGNPLEAILPASIGNLSTSLQELYIAYSELKGGIPIEIGNLRNLNLLILFSNQLTGSIPQSLGRLQNIQRLILSDNKFMGDIPSGLCQLHSLVDLDMSSNRISGQLLDCLGNLTSLTRLSLGFNRLKFGIPASLWNLEHLLELSLPYNLLNGSISHEVGRLNELITLDLTENQFSGGIPNTIGALQKLINFSLAYNTLQGTIPKSIGDILSLEILDLSHNNLSGIIPKSLEKLRNIKYFNVSFNDLSGEIPTGGCFANFTAQEFVSNGPLCGLPRFYVPPCQGNNHVQNSRKKRVLIVATVSSITISFIVVVYLLVKYKRKHNPSNVVENATENPFSAIELQRISYYELFQATGGFSPNNLIGTGSIGSVYKGILNDGMVVAIKVFNQSDDGDKSFDVECQVLRNVRHRNLTKVITGCVGDNFKALVLEFMSNGSLEEWLYSQNSLSIGHMFNTMIDVACALEYLHHGYSTSIVHCDLKPSNVLLDEEMVAHVSDFSITKLMGVEESFVHTKTLATLGYMAPEYGLEGIISTRCDVYSYGIMLMEILSKRKPTDDMFTEDMSLRSWIRDSLPDGVVQVVDTNLLGQKDGKSSAMLECVSSLLELALNCAAESPDARPNFKDIVVTLKKIQVQFDKVLL